MMCLIPFILIFQVCSKGNNNINKKSYKNRLLCCTAKDFLWVKNTYKNTGFDNMKRQLLLISDYIYNVIFSLTYDNFYGNYFHQNIEKKLPKQCSYVSSITRVCKLLLCHIVQVGTNKQSM